MCTVTQPEEKDWIFTKSGNQSLQKVPSGIKQEWMIFFFNLYFDQIKACEW
jgi:hypothetical protein